MITNLTLVRINVVSAVLACAALALAPGAARARSCEDLSKLGSTALSISLAQPVSAGGFSPEGGGRQLDRLPPFCRVTATLRPTSDSTIHTETWLPLAGWNGKLLAVGSGGWGGSIAYGELAEALHRGYAASATDDGHTGGSASPMMGHPQKLIDFAYRAEHAMTVEAKALIEAFYGRAARHSYWNGCSGGGREGLLQAARYPEEFDGIIAGDPANIRRNAWALWLAVSTFKDPRSYIPPAKYPMIHQAVLAACDARDGVKDGLISEPESCHIDFKALQCKASDRGDCLTPAQVQSARTLISPAATAQGTILFPGLAPGSELRWGRLAGGPEPAGLFLDEFRYLVYRDPTWDWRSFDLQRDAAKAHAIDRDLDELDPHLAAFAKHGGKLLIYHGWADQQVSPGSSIEFYRSAIASSAAAGQGSDWIRLFMAPGMAHCSGGEGPDTFDKIGALEQWVEHGKAPERIVAAHLTEGKVDRTRPLCPYPRVARYDGHGTTDDAANFTCRAPRRGMGTTAR